MLFALVPRSSVRPLVSLLCVCTVILLRWCAQIRLQSIKHLQLRILVVPENLSITVDLCQFRINVSKETTIEIVVR